MIIRLAAATLLGLLLPVSAHAVDLVDLGDRHWATPAVRRTVAAGVLAGFPDHTFRGWRQVSRYELVGAASKLLPDGQAAVTADVPGDVPADHWALPALTRFYQLRPDGPLWREGPFSGDQPASRYELAYFAATLGDAWMLMPGQDAGVGPFDDVTPDHWAAAAVRHVHGMGLMSGRADQRFHGDDPIDRYQLAAVLDQLLQTIQTQLAVHESKTQANRHGATDDPSHDSDR